MAERETGCFWIIRATYKNSIFLQSTYTLGVPAARRRDDGAPKPARIPAIRLKDRWKNKLRRPPGETEDCLERVITGNVPLHTPGDEKNFATRTASAAGQLVVHPAVEPTGAAMEPTAAAMEPTAAAMESAS